MLVNTITNEVLSEESFRGKYPNISFPNVLTDSILSEYNYAVLGNRDVPTTPTGFNLIRTGVSKDSDGYYIKYDLIPYTEQELSNYSAGLRARRDSLLNLTDWTQGKDIPDSISNKWAPYRQNLRDITLQSGFPFSVEWPVSPDTLAPVINTSGIDATPLEVGVSI